MAQMETKNDQPEVRCGQWWADNDPRTIVGRIYQRVGQIIEFRSHETKGIQALVQWRPPPSDYAPNRSRTWVSVKRFRRASSTGYVYLGTKAPPANIGPGTTWYGVEARTTDQIASAKLSEACQRLNMAIATGDQQKAEDARGTVVMHIAELLGEFGLLDVAQKVREQWSEFDGRHIEDDLWECPGCRRKVPELRSEGMRLLCDECRRAMK